MRLPEENEDLIGKVCVCSVGRPGIVVGQRYFEHIEGLMWVGLGLDGKGVWASSNPCIISNDGNSFHDKLVDRFDGKMSL